MIMPTKPTMVEIDMSQLEDALRRAEAKLDEKDFAMLKALAESYAYLTDLVGDKNTSIARLRKLLFGAKTEKTAAVIDGGKDSRPLPTEAATASAVATVEADAETAVPPAMDSENAAETPGKGHGRNGADAYTSAEKIEVGHQSLQPGDPCPQCDEGTVYETKRPGVLVRLVGQPPVGAKVYYLQKLRCNLCGVVFTADLPAGVDADEKYAPTVGSMIALLKYGSGMPFHRAETLQENLGVPLPASTQWDIVEAQAESRRAGFRRTGPASGARRRGFQRRYWGEDSGDDGRASPTSGLGGRRLPNTPWTRRRRRRRQRRIARACSPRASSRPGKGTRLPCSSADANMLGRI